MFWPLRRVRYPDTHRIEQSRSLVREDEVERNEHKKLDDDEIEHLSRPDRKGVGETLTKRGTSGQRRGRLLTL